MALVKHSGRYPGRADSTRSYKPATDRLRPKFTGEAEGHRSMNQYLPWLLIIAGIVALAAVIYWRMTYVVSD
jgi:type VI protein secretion system component VasF